MRSSLFSRAAVLLGSALLAHHLSATTWVVGPGQSFTAPSQVSTLVDDGDTVDIMAGVYPSDVARWTANDLLLRGMGGYVELESNGMSFGDKAIWVIAGNNATVRYIAFSECAVPDHNGAGIRLEGLGLSVDHCYFHHNENGILCGEYHPCTVRIEHSEFAYNGYGDGYSHNLYIGHVDSLVFRYNYCHHAHVGHELKSRAWVNVIEYNRIGNEADGDASREIDLPNGGQAYIIGNSIQQGPQSENSNMVGFGLEGLTNPGPQELYAVNNTLVNEQANGTFFQAPADAYFKAYSNLIAGGGTFMSTWPTSIDTLGNLRATSIAYFHFADPTAYDYHIGFNSPAHNTGFPAGLATSGYPLVAWYEYVHPMNGTLRCQHATLDAGAFETCTTGIPTEAVDIVGVYPNPADERVRITVREHEVITNVELIDGAGRTVKHASGTGANTTLIDIRDLPVGTFTVRVSTASSHVLRSSFVKVWP